MQTQPKSDVKTARQQRARQAALVSDDTFKGGDTAPRQRLSLTSPWNVGTSRLFAGRKAPDLGR